MAELAQSFGFNVVEYISVLYQFVQFFIVFNPLCCVSHLRILIHNSVPLQRSNRLREINSVFDSRQSKRFSIHQNSRPNLVPPASDSLNTGGYLPSSKATWSARLTSYFFLVPQLRMSGSLCSIISELTFWCLNYFFNFSTLCI